MGNNFISNSPKKIKFDNKAIFALYEKNIGVSDAPLISAIIRNNDNIAIVEVNDNKCDYCDTKLIKKIDSKEHILIIDEGGEIVFESRLLDKNTMLVSGIFNLDNNQKLVITQNYITLPSGKWIMHDRINSNNKDVIITNDGIKASD